MGHRVYFPDLSDESTGLITITGDEAHHALRVKRLDVGDEVKVLNGEGLIGHTRIHSADKTRDGWAMNLAIERLEEVPPRLPSVNVASAVPKGERLEDMIDGLSQVGASSWRPIKTKRSVVDPRDGKLERLERTVIESMKQSGRAWPLMLMTLHTYKQVLNSIGRVWVADADAPPYQATGEDSVLIIIGPEGGWDPEELEYARTCGLGTRFASFGPYVMRTEVAAIAAATQALAAEKAYRATVI